MVFFQKYLVKYSCFTGEILRKMLLLSLSGCVFGIHICVDTEVYRNTCMLTSAWGKQSLLLLFSFHLCMQCISIYIFLSFPLLLSVYLSIFCLYVYLFICLSVYQSIYMHVSIFLSIYIYHPPLSLFISSHLPMCLFLSLFLSVLKINKVTIHFHIYASHVLSHPQL